MQQVMYANGKLWGALNRNETRTAAAARRDRIVNRSPDAAKIVMQGYLGAAGYDFTYPAIGVTPSGTRRDGVRGDGRHAKSERCLRGDRRAGGVSSWGVIAPGGTVNPAPG